MTSCNDQDALESEDKETTRESYCAVREVNHIGAFEGLAPCLSSLCRGSQARSSLLGRSVVRPVEHENCECKRTRNDRVTVIEF